MARRGCVYERPHRSGYSARVKIKGIYQHRGGFSTKAMAEAWIAAQLNDEMRAEVLGIEAVRDDKAFDSFLPQWKQSLQGRCSPKTIEGYVSVADGVLAPHFKGKILSTITQENIHAFESARIAKGVRPATLNRYRTVMSSILKRAVEVNFARENVTRGMKHLREAVRSMHYLGQEDELRLFAAMPPWLRIPSLLALDAGLREGEVLNLTMRDIYLGRKPPVVVVRTSKNYQPREVGLTARLIEALVAYLPTIAKGQDFLFAEEDGSSPVRKDTLWNAFRTARRRAKLPTFRFHDFRHMYGTRLAEAGATPAQIKAALGHKSLAATMRYIDHAPEGASRSMGRFLDQARAIAKSATGHQD
jgi:integrase